MELFWRDLLGDKWGGLVAKYLPIICLVIVAFIVIKVIMKFVEKLIKKSKMPKSAHVFASTAIKIVLYFLVLLIICGQLGIDVTSLVAAFSIVGVAFSLSIQGSLSNVMSGITLLFTKQFGVDDYIEAGGVSGTVVEIGISHCRLRTPDNKDIYVPNSTIVSEKIINYSTEKKRRVDITIGASYAANIDEVKKVLQNVVESTPKIIMDDPIFIGITAYKDSCVDYTVRVWAKNGDYWDVYLPMLEKIKRAFDENNIEIPYNKLDVNLMK